MIKLRGKVYWADFYKPNKERVRKSLGTTDKAEALRMVSKLYSEALNAPTARAQNQLEAQGAQLTLEEAYKGALKEYEPWRTAKSMRSLVSTWAHISNYFGATRRMSTIGSKDVLLYVQDMQKCNLTGSTINQRLSFISVLYDRAKDWGYDSLEKPKMPRQKVNKGRQRRISAIEEQMVIDLFSKGVRPWHEHMAALVPVLIDTGVRLSEALRIRDIDIDLENNCIIIWENKADHPRAVPMTSRVRHIMTERKKSPAVFGGLTVFTADKEWAWVRTRMGLEEDKEFVIHALRHSTASRLADAGVDSFRIQKMMGHKTITTTQKYVHVSAQALQDLTGLLEKASKGTNSHTPENKNGASE